MNILFFINQKFFRNQLLKQGIHHQELTLFWYKMRKLEELESEILDLDNIYIKYLQKGKRRLFWDIIYNLED
ncbi:MAG: hypothetical protein ACTSVL_11630 [Promethearchaeota archaeon]